MADMQTLLRLKQKQLEVMRAEADSTQPSVEQGSAIGRIGVAAYEGLKAPFQTPVQPASEFVQQNLIGNNPLNKFLLDTIPQAAQAGMKIMAAPISAITGAAGQALEEIGGLPGATINQGPDITAAMNEQLMAAAPEIGIAGANIKTPVRIPQIVKGSSKLEPGAAEAAQTLAFQKQPPTLLQKTLGLPGSPTTLPAAKATTSMALDMLSNTAETSVLSGKLRGVNAKAEMAAENAVRGFAQDITTGMSKEHVGEVLKSAVENRIDAFEAVAKGAYAAVDEATKFDISAKLKSDPIGATQYVQDLIASANGNSKSRANAAAIYQGMVDLRPVKRAAQNILGEVEAGIDPTGSAFLNNIISKKNFVTFRDAQILRSDLLKLGYNITENIPGRNKVFGKRLSPLVDTAMQNAADQLGAEGLAAWRNANALWKQGKEVFNSQIMKGIANKDADVIYQSLVKNNRPVNIRRVRDLVGPEVWKNVQGQFVQDMLNNSIDGTQLSGDKLTSAIKKFQDGGIYGEVITDAETANRWKMLARTLQIAQKGNATSAMKIRATITSGFVPEIYAAIQIMRGTGTVTNGAILLGPSVLNRILSSPRLTKFMIEGIGNPSGSVKGMNATRNFTAALIANGIVDKNQNPVENLDKINAATIAENARQNNARAAAGMVPIGP